MSDETKKYVDIDELVSTDVQREFMAQIKETIMKTLVNGGPVKIPGLGTVILHSRKIRMGKDNPNAGKKLVKARVTLDDNIKQKIDSSISEGNGYGVFDANNR